MTKDRLTPRTEARARECVRRGWGMHPDDGRALLRELDLMRADETLRMTTLASHSAWMDREAANV